MYVYIDCWQPFSQEKKTNYANHKEKYYWNQIPKQKMGTSVKAKLIGAKTKANTDSTSFLIDVVWDGRLWYNCTNDDCSHQRSLTEWMNEL